MSRFIHWTMALVAWAACDSSSTSAIDGPVARSDGLSADAPRSIDGPSPSDGPIIIIDGASSPIDASPSSGDGGTTLTCAMTIAAYCATPGTCISSWQDVPTCGSAHDATRTCGNLQAFVNGGVDTSRTSYYDASGQLVAIVDFNLVHSGCTAGPSTFVAPDCGDLHPLHSCPDAGP